MGLGVLASQVSLSHSQAPVWQRPWPVVADSLHLASWLVALWLWLPNSSPLFQPYVRFSSLFFFFWNSLEIPFFYMCEVSWVFPTPRLGRCLIRTDFDFFFFFFFVACVCFGVLFGLNFCYWANIFFIEFKNINNIVKGGKVQFYWNKLLKIIYYIYTNFLLYRQPFYINKSWEKV